MWKRGKVMKETKMYNGENTNTIMFSINLHILEANNSINYISGTWNY